MHIKTMDSLIVLYNIDKYLHVVMLIHVDPKKKKKIRDIIYIHITIDTYLCHLLNMDNYLA